MIMRKRTSVAVITVLSICLFFGNSSVAYASEPPDTQLPSFVSDPEEDILPDDQDVTGDDDLSPDDQDLTGDDDLSQDNQDVTGDDDLSQDDRDIQGDDVLKQDVQDSENPDSLNNEVIHYVEIPVTHESGADLPGGDEDARFEGYVDKVMGEGTGDGEFTFKRAFSSRRAFLPPAGQNLYDVLRAECIRIAAGENDNSFLLFFAEDVLDQTEFTYAELGLFPGATEDEIVAAVKALFGTGNMRQLVLALMADMPYEMYWFDKTEGWIPYYPKIAYTGSKVSLYDVVGCRFSVAAAYSPDGSLDGYLLNTKKTGATTTARRNAEAIVAAHASESDYQKMVSYRDEICRRVAYNYPAVRYNTAYGDPWQLIYIFDDDPDTKVVCEGYSKGLQLLCDLSDFTGSLTECYTMFGNVIFDTGNEGGHMWNIVRMDNGLNYLVDLTNCDRGDYADDLYFLKGDADATPAGFTVSGSRFVYDKDCISSFSEKERQLSGGETYLADVSVNQTGDETPVTGIRLNYRNRTVRVGDTCKLIAEVLPGDATNRRYSFSSSNTAVAEVAQDGTVTAITAGSAVITATSVDGGYTATCTVNVPVPATDVVISKISATLDAGQTMTLSAYVLPGDAGEPNIIWYSDNESVATVSQQGVVTAKKGGRATIMAWSGDGRKHADCDLTVISRVRAVTLNRTSASLEKGKTLQLSATVTPADAVNKNVTWKSSNANVATVSASGLVTAKSKGSAVITVTTQEGAKTASCNLTVTVPVQNTAPAPVQNTTPAPVQSTASAISNRIVSPYSFGGGLSSYSFGGGTSAFGFGSSLSSFRPGGGLSSFSFGGSGSSFGFGGGLSSFRFGGGSSSFGFGGGLSSFSFGSAGSSFGFGSGAFSGGFRSGTAAGFGSYSNPFLTKGNGAASRFTVGYALK